MISSSVELTENLRLVENPPGHPGLLLCRSFFILICLFIPGLEEAGTGHPAVPGREIHTSNSRSSASRAPPEPVYLIPRRLLPVSLQQTVRCLLAPSQVCDGHPKITLRPSMGDAFRLGPCLAPCPALGLSRSPIPRCFPGLGDARALAGRRW